MNMMGKTDIINLYDRYDEGKTYSYIEIVEGNIDKFRKCLRKYQKDNQDEYDLDGFMDLINKKKWFVRSISSDYEVDF